MTPQEIVSGASHGFDIGIARELGINAAIIYNHIVYWIMQNAMRKDEMIDGKYWMYETQQQMADFLGYMSVEEVKKSVVKLLDKGILIKGNYNKNPFDRTAWYTVYDQNIIKKTLTKAPYGAMDRTESAPSESAVRRDVLYNKKQEDKHKNNNKRKAVVVPSFIEEISDLTDAEKKSLVKFSEERIKLAVEFNRVEPPTTTKIQQLVWHCQQTTPPKPKAKSKKMAIYENTMKIKGIYQSRSCELSVTKDAVYFVLRNGNSEPRKVEFSNPDAEQEIKRYLNLYKFKPFS